MQYLSMHITDIVQNSLNANASKIEIAIAADTAANTFCLTITDDGHGMGETFLKTAASPFSTTNTARSVGLGLALLNQTATLCNGFLEISSIAGVGTKIHAQMQLNHINLPPMGDLAATIHAAIIANPKADFVFAYTYGNHEFVLDTTEIKQVLDGVALTDSIVVRWLRKTLIEGIDC